MNTEKLDSLMARASMIGAIEIYRQVGRMADLERVDVQSELMTALRDAYLDLRPQFVPEWDDLIRANMPDAWAKALLQAQACAVALRACRTMGLGPAIAAMPKS